MKYTLITGATRGIGYELAQIYAQNGHHLILIARNEAKLQEMKQNFSSKYQVVIEVFAVDLSNLAATESLITEIKANYQLEALILNAGIGEFNKVDDLTLAEIEKQFNVNVYAPMLFTKHLLKNIKQNQGSIIYLCSILSYFSNYKASVYVSTKHALLGFANNVRLEHPDLHVLTIHPSTVNTGFVGEVSRALAPEKVAKLIHRAHKKRKTRLNIPKGIALLRLFNLWFPKTFERLNRKFFSNKIN